VRDEHAAPAFGGEVTIATTAIAQAAGRTAAECYGVVGTASRGGRIGALLSRDRPERGVEIVRTPEGLVIALRVVVEHGLNLAEVASTVRSHVGYEIARLTGIPVSRVDVHIADVRTSQ
jgi:uncharacterized alkaline shock family protein YloU